MISVVLDMAGGALLLLGLVLLTISLIGVLRQPGTFGQLHAQGLATGPGVMAVLASSIATENAATITFAVLAIVFIALTSPVSAHAIARAAHRRRPRRHGAAPKAAAPEGTAPDGEPEQTR
ncbi:multicomponent Na+:H+ antiporter subunit G [Lentzea fradiae]|uniref:Multicomponent Na+:H+ antiporter subunit G n=1 Tax=Lentzea fradiae TaxID=200378 RepID=A0A1G7KW58_9PSEU|nr:monovalent cation/H(+) antiporter subunit G [Lentzea fradiae]SDF41326.1 multicomponent Na+:H+ antiporter subunit G [Lentzea fradiae]